MVLLKLRLPLRFTTSAPLLVMLTEEMLPFRSLVPICRVPLLITTVPMSLMPWLATIKVFAPFLVSEPTPVRLPLPVKEYCSALLLTMMLPGDKDVVRTMFDCTAVSAKTGEERSEEHTSELQSRQYLVCRL